MHSEDLEQNLVAKQECYICLELCTTPSPCLCTSFVHKHCLKTYIDTQQKQQCAVCLAKFPPIQSRWPLWKVGCLWAIVNIIAFVLQWMGTYSWIQSPIVIVTAVVSTLIFAGGQLLKHQDINQCLVYKELFRHK